METKRILPFLIGLAALTSLLAFAAACDEGATAPVGQAPVAASEWISSVDWTQATVVQVNMVENGDGSLAFAPSNLSFEAGKPYILRMVNAPTNLEKHYFAVEGLGNFYKAIATRKIETADAEYKAPHFEAVELLIGGTLDLYFVPVLAGTYDILCTITGHKDRGMFGQVTITGGAGNQLDLEIAADFNAALATDARKSSSHAVWGARVDETVQIVETPNYAFIPTDLALTKDVGYKITLESALGNELKHYYTAPAFYKTVVVRKAEDSHAEIKPLYFTAIELLPERRTHLFVVPTEEGTFSTECTIAGHAALGMIGTVVVSP